MTEPHTHHAAELIERKPDAPGAVDASANYAYWREHGGAWADEYDTRKRYQVYYHIQELMLAEYIAEHARNAGSSLRVLEFGCGVGRHLKNLSTIPGVDVNGYDQSAAMVSGMLRWTGQAWIDEHVTVGPPTGRLPFEDRSFDIVYSSEVLVHVRPEHLEGILRELVRVCRGHILHIEPGDQAEICGTAHHGCWRHDLAAVYARLGLDCETLGSGFQVQTPRRVVIGAEPVYTWPAWKLEMLRRLDRDIEKGFELARERAAAAEAQARAMEQRAEQASALARENETKASQLSVTVEREWAERLAQVKGRADALAAELAETRSLIDPLRVQLEHERAALEVRVAKARNEGSAELALARGALDLARIRGAELEYRAQEAAARADEAARQLDQLRAERAAVVARLREIAQVEGQA